MRAGTAHTTAGCGARIVRDMEWRCAVHAGSTPCVALYKGHVRTSAGLGPLGCPATRALRRSTAGCGTALLATGKHLHMQKCREGVTPCMDMRAPAC